jgi:hypothetical protein
MATLKAELRFEPNQRTTFTSSVSRTGVGEFIEVGNLTTRRLSDLITKIKNNPKYAIKRVGFKRS